MFTSGACANSWKMFLRAFAVVFLAVGVMFVGSGDSYADETGSAHGQPIRFSVLTRDGVLCLYNREVLELPKVGDVAPDMTQDGAASGGVIEYVWDGDFEALNEKGGGIAPWREQGSEVLDKIKTVRTIDKIAPAKTTSWFEDCKNLKEADMGKLYANNATSTAQMFKNCTSLTKFDGFRGKFENIEAMYFMFQNCTSLVNANFALGWDSERSPYTSGLFDDCKSLKSASFAYWESSDLLFQNGEFGGCKSLESLTLSKRVHLTMLPFNKYGWRDINDEKAVYHTLDELVAFDVSRDYEITYVNYEVSRFSVLADDGTLLLYNRKTKEAPAAGDSVPGYDGHVTAQLVEGDYATEGTIPWNGIKDKITAARVVDEVAAPASISEWFLECHNLTSVDLRLLNTSGLVDASKLFWGCTSLAKVSFSDWDVSSLNNVAYMFWNCSSLGHIGFDNWNTRSDIKSFDLFYGCKKLSEIALGPNAHLLAEESQLPFNAHGWGTSSQLEIEGTAFHDRESLSKYDSARSERLMYTNYTWARDPVVWRELGYDGTERAGVEEPAASVECGYTLSGTLKATEVGNYTAVATLKEGFRWANYAEPLVSWTLEPKTLEWSIVKDLPVAFAVWTEEDETFRICHRSHVPEIGDEFLGRTVSNVWTYDPSDTSKLAPWITDNDLKKKVKHATVEDRVAPVSTLLWFDAFEILEDCNAAKLDFSHVADARGMFQDCSSLKRISGHEDWDTSSLVEADSIFNGCTALTSLDLSAWNTSKLSGAGGIYRSCTSLSSLELGSKSLLAANCGLPFDDCVWKASDGSVFTTLDEMVAYDQARTSELETYVRLKLAEKPEAIVGHVYNGKKQTGVEADEGYTLSGSSATDAGDYIATVTPKEGYAWADGSEGAVEVAWSIAKSDAGLTVEPIPVKAYGSADFDLQVRCDSGNPIEYSSSDTAVAVVDGYGKVSLRGVGTSVITVTAKETTNYKADECTVCLTVNKAQLDKPANLKWNGHALVWDTVKNATSYTVEIYKDDKLVSTKKVRTPRLEIEKFEACHKYMVSVAAIADAKVYRASGKSSSSALLEHSYAKTKRAATAKKNGEIRVSCSKCGNVKSRKTIHKIASIDFDALKYTYDGKVKSPKITVKDSKGSTLKKRFDFTVLVPKGRKNVGTYSYKIAFKGNYSGIVSKAIVISPRKTKVVKAMPAKGSLTVSWSKRTKQATGYQIQYSTSRKFAKPKVNKITIANNKTTLKKIGKLTSGKNYYVKIRTYKSVSGKRYYSAWSNVKKVKVK